MNQNWPPLQLLLCDAATLASDGGAEAIRSCIEAKEEKLVAHEDHIPGLPTRNYYNYILYTANIASITEEAKLLAELVGGKR